MDKLEKFINDLNRIQNELKSDEARPKQTENDYHDKMAKFLFSADTGWKILTSIYSQQIQVNEIFGEKLINLLLHTCGQLLLDLDPASKYKIQEKEIISLRLCLNESESDENDRTKSLIINNEAFDIPSISSESEEGCLFEFFIICLSLFMRYNNGTNNCILLNKSNNTILNEFCDILFNKYETSSEEQIEKIIYLKFLHQIYARNFENLNKHRQNANVSNKMPSNALFFEQFSLISKSFHNQKHIRLRKYLVIICIDYFYNYSLCTNFLISQNSGAKLSTKFSIYSTNNSNLSFNSLCIILDKTFNFIINNMLLLDDIESARSDEKSRQNIKRVDLYWKKLNDVLAEMKLYKNNHHHVQTCLRSKHSSQSCKSSINEIGSKHNDISFVDNHSCIFAQIAKNLFLILIENSTPNSNFISTNRYESSSPSFFSIKFKRLYGLIQKLGICTCVPLKEFVDFQKHSNKILDIQNKSIRIENYYFSEKVCSEVVFEYFFLLINEENESSIKSDDLEDSPISIKNVNTRRKSVFLPLLVEQQLIKDGESEKNILFNLENDEPNTDLFKNFNEIILRFDEKSVLLSKYLSTFLTKYAKFVPINAATKNKILNSRITDDVLNDISDDSGFKNKIIDEDGSNSSGVKFEINHTQSIKYKWITYEIFYLFKNIIDKIVEENTESQDPRKAFLSLTVFKIITNYLSEFLILTTNSSLSMAEINWDEHEQEEISSKANSPMYRQAKVDISLNNHQMEKKMFQKFFKFMDTNSIKLNEKVLDLCVKFSHSPILSITLCSQIILFKNQQLNQKQLVSKQLQTSRDIEHDISLNIEQHLSKSLVDLIDKNPNLLDNYLVIDILLELYVKCANFRYNLNEWKNFHSNLLNCFNKCLEAANNESKAKNSNVDCNTTKYMEIVLHLIFVYFYYNKKVKENI